MRDDSNGAIRVVIQDLENTFWIFNRNYNFVTEITILPIFQKLEFLGSYNSTGHLQSQQLVSERGSSLGGIMVESYSGPMIKLIATNYSLWKSMMEDLLNCKDLYDPMEGDKA